jgi:ABC-2 type transport system permease protein
MLNQKQTFKGLFNWTFFLIFLVAIILVNVVSSFINKRWDMTEDERFSLAQGTIDFLQNEEKLEDRLSIKIYLAGNLPAEINTFKNALENKLKEFKEYTGKNIEYQFINPNDGTKEENQALFETLYAKGKGIIPMDIKYMEDGAHKELMTWPGATIDYKGSTVHHVQLLPGTSPGHPYSLPQLESIIQNSITNLEYMLITSLRRAIQDKKPRIAFLQGHEELSYQQTQRMRALISPYFHIADITLNDSLHALDDVDGLIIANPKKTFSDKDLYIIDQFVMKGGRLMCFLEALTFNDDSLNINGVSHTTRVNTGLSKLLFDYGLKLNDNYVLDSRCAPRVFPYAQNSLMPWFFHVLATPTLHPISRNVDPVSLKYCNEIQFIETPNVALTPVLTSSTNSTPTGLAPMISLAMPLNYKKTPLVPNPEDETNKKCLAGLAEGIFTSHFKNRIVDDFAKNPLVKYKDKSVKEGKVLLIGNGTFIENQYDSTINANGDVFYQPKPHNDLKTEELFAKIGVGVYFGNQEFIQNLTDYMMGDNSVLDIRSRQIDIHAIDSEKVMKHAGFYKFINVVLPCLIILLLAFVMHRIRKMKYAKITTNSTKKK